jgi:hypothetical protein
MLMGSVWETVFPFDVRLAGTTRNYGHSAIIPARNKHIAVRIDVDAVYMGPFPPVFKWAYRILAWVKQFPCFCPPNFFTSRIYFYDVISQHWWKFFLGSPHSTLDLFRVLVRYFDPDGEDGVAIIKPDEVVVHCDVVVLPNYLTIPSDFLED